MRKARDDKFSSFTGSNKRASPIQCRTKISSRLPDAGTQWLLPCLPLMDSRRRSVGRAHPGSRGRQTESALSLFLVFPLFIAFTTVGRCTVVDVVITDFVRGSYGQRKSLNVQKPHANVGTSATSMVNTADCCCITVLANLAGAARAFDQSMPEELVVLHVLCTRRLPGAARRLQHRCCSDGRDPQLLRCRRPVKHTSCWVRRLYIIKFLNQSHMVDIQLR